VDGAGPGRTGIRSAAVVAVAVGQQGVDPRDAGTAGALNNVSQQLGSALGVALISTFVATATSHYLTRHGSTAVSAQPCTGSPSATGGPLASSGPPPSSAVP